MNLWFSVCGPHKSEWTNTKYVDLPNMWNIVRRSSTSNFKHNPSFHYSMAHSGTEQHAYDVCMKLTKITGHKVKHSFIQFTEEIEE